MTREWAYGTGMPYMLLLVLQGRPKIDCTVMVVIFTGALVVELSIRVFQYNCKCPCIY